MLDHKENEPAAVLLFPVVFTYNDLNPIAKLYDPLVAEPVTFSPPPPIHILQPSEEVEFKLENKISPPFVFIFNFPKISSIFDDFSQVKPVSALYPARTVESLHTKL